MEPSASSADNSSNLPDSGLLVTRPVQQVVLETLILVVMWTVSVLFNGLVCLVIYKSRRMQSTTNYFVVSLAVSDLAMAVCSMPFVLVRLLSHSWVFGSFLCKCVRFMQYALPGTAMYVLVAICIDRFYTIIYPLSFKVTRGTAKRMILSSWIIAAAIAAFCFYFFEVFDDTSSKRSFCPTYIPVLEWAGIFYTISLVLLTYIFPVVLTLFGYFKLFGYIWKTGSSGPTFTRTMNPVPRAKAKMVKMLMLVSTVTVVAFLPFYVTQVWYCATNPLGVEPTVFVVATWTMFSTSVAKPLIYLRYNSNFRRGCKEVFCMSTMKCYRSNTYAITTATAFGKKNFVGIMESTASTDVKVDSPVKAFNRAPLVEKSAWPLSSAMPSTYL